MVLETTWCFGSKIINPGKENVPRANRGRTPKGELFFVSFLKRHNLDKVPRKNILPSFLAHHQYKSKEIAVSEQELVTDWVKETVEGSRLVGE